MRKKAAALLLVSAATLSVLVMLPGAQAVPGASSCLVERNGASTTTVGCPYIAVGNLQTGYVVAVTPGTTWEIYSEVWNPNTNQFIHSVIQNQDTAGSGTTPCLDTFVGPTGTKHWLCAKSLPQQDGVKYGAVISSGSGVIEVGPQIHP